MNAETAVLFGMLLCAILIALPLLAKLLDK